MREYKIVSVLWEDHTAFRGAQLPSEPDGMIIPSLSIGLLYKKTKRYIVLIQHLERYVDRDESDYMLILRNSILGIQEHGKIPIEGLRNKEGST